MEIITISVDSMDIAERVFWGSVRDDLGSSIEHGFDFAVFMEGRDFGGKEPLKVPVDEEVDSFTCKVEAFQCTYVQEFQEVNDDIVWP